MQKFLESKRESHEEEGKFIDDYVGTLQEFKEAYFVEPTRSREEFHDPARDLMNDWGLEEPLEKILKRRPNALKRVPAEDLEYMPKAARHVPPGGAAKMKRDLAQKAGGGEAGEVAGAHMHELMNLTQSDRANAAEPERELNWNREAQTRRDWGNVSHSLETMARNGGENELMAVL